jgi:hypothetical protein
LVEVLALSPENAGNVIQLSLRLRHFCPFKLGQNNILGRRNVQGRAQQVRFAPALEFFETEGPGLRARRFETGGST